MLLVRCFLLSVSCVIGLILPQSLQRLKRVVAIDAFDNERIVFSGGGDKFSVKGGKRTRSENYAVVSSWRCPEKSVIEYQVDRKIWLRRLPRGTDAAYLRDVMSDAFGPVISTEVAPDDTAYVVFEHPNDAEKAARTSIIIRSGDELTDMTIESEIFKPRLPPPQAGNRRVFVGNIPYEGVTNDLLDKLFMDGGCARPISKRRPYPGIAYLEFPTDQDARRALALAGTRLLGRAIRIDYDHMRAHKIQPPSQLLDEQPSVSTNHENNAFIQHKTPVINQVTTPRMKQKESSPSVLKNNRTTEKKTQINKEILEQKKIVKNKAVPIDKNESNLAAVPIEINKSNLSAVPIEKNKSNFAAVPIEKNKSNLSAVPNDENESNLAAVRAAAISAATAWRQAEALRSRVSFLESRVPRRATWQPLPFAIRLGTDARPRDILRLRVESRELELVVPETAGPGSLLVVRGALECIVPRGAIPGEAIAVPIPGNEELVIVVPPGRRPGMRLYLAYPVDDLTPTANALPPPRLPELLPPPPTNQLPPGPLDLSSISQEKKKNLDMNALALRAVPNSELAALRAENAQLKRELAAMRKTLATLTQLQENDAVLSKSKEES